jgi:hypothetical protein
MSEYGPHEYYHNENNEPMFRGIKVRNLAEMFENEENYRDYTIDQFKEWLSKSCPEEDWTYINFWGRLDCFNSILLKNKDIFDYLFQLGMDPFSLYLSSIKDVERLQNRLKDLNCEYRETRIKMLKKAKELLSISSKYINPVQAKYALKIKDIDYF